MDGRLSAERLAEQFEEMCYLRELAGTMVAVGKMGLELPGLLDG